MKYTKNVLNAVLGIGALSVFMIGGAFSYFTDNEIITNVVTVGDVIVDLVVKTDKSQPGAPIYMLPNQSISIETYAVNSGTEDIVVFMEVLFPARDGVTHVSDTGVPLENSPRAIYSFLEPIDSNWISIENRGYGSDGKWDVTLTVDNASYIGYVYGYYKKLDVGERTVPLFESLKCANFTEKNIFKEEHIWEEPYLPVTVRVFAVQSELIKGAEIVSGDGSPVATENVTLDNLDLTSLGYILNTFTNQNYNTSINGWYYYANEHGKLNFDGSIEIGN